MDEKKTAEPPLDLPEERPPHEEPSFVMLRCPFDPIQKRHEMVSRLLELRSIIPDLQEEKTRLEGSIRLLDEIAPPRGMANPPIGGGDLDGGDGPNGKPRGGE